MTALETWLTETAAELAKTDEEAAREVATTLEQRFAIGMVQARAQECRHIAGELLIKGTANPISQPLLVLIARFLTDRAFRLEQIGLNLAAKYPPDTPTVPLEKPKVTLQ